MYSSFHRSPCVMPTKSPYPTSANPIACNTFANRNTLRRPSLPPDQMLMLKYGVCSVITYLMLNRWRMSIFTTTATMFRKRKPVR